MTRGHTAGSTTFCYQPGTGKIVGTKNKQGRRRDIAERYGKSDVKKQWGILVNS